MTLLYRSDVICVYVGLFIQIIGLSMWLELEKVIGYCLGSLEVSLI